MMSSSMQDAGRGTSNVNEWVNIWNEMETSVMLNKHPYFVRAGVCRVGRGPALPARFSTKNLGTLFSRQASIESMNHRQQADLEPASLSIHTSIHIRALHRRPPHLPPQMISRRQKKQRQPQQQQQDPPSSSSLPPPELAAFSLAAAIQEARTSFPQQQQQQQQRSSNNNNRGLPFFNKLSSSSSPLKKKNPSQASLATNTSFATANDNFRTSSEQNITPSAVSYFVDSSSDEETQESLTFGNDPLSVLSRNQDVKPTEISFFENTTNPEETTTVIIMAKKNKSSKIAPMTAAPAAVDPTPVPEATPTPTTTTEIIVEKKDTEEPHFDIAQNIYGCTKDIWAWGKTIPVLSNVLDLTEGATAKVLDITIHMDLPSIDQDVVVPHAKKLDDVVITPAICAVWGIVCPAVGMGEEMIVKPVMSEVVPRILGPLGLLEKKMEEENVIDRSPNPEVVPVALNWKVRREWDIC